MYGYSGAIQPFQGTVHSGTLGDAAADAEGAALLKQLHAVAVNIYNARTRGDVGEVARLRDQFAAIAEQIRKLGDQDMTAIDRFVLAVGNYVSGVVDAIPSAMAALPTAIAKGTIQAAVPWVLGGVALLWIIHETPGARRLL